MDKNTKARFEIRANIFKAMGHPTRLFIIEKIAKKPICVNDLAEMVGADISTISKHLTVLKSAGIIQDEKRGTWIFYRLKMPCVLNFFKCVESVIQITAREKLNLSK